MSEPLALGYEGESLYEQALKLAESLHLPLDNNAKQRLILTNEKLVLKLAHFSPLSPDFNSKTWQNRRDEGKRQGLVRACKPAPGIKIIDATAGWGRDAAILASFGAEVTMLERKPIMAALLADALSRQNEKSKKNLNLKLMEIDALTYLDSLSKENLPEVIYIDPMHPQREKSALVKKEMQSLQQLFGADEDAQSLLELALTKALNRIVVKWPQNLPSLLPPERSIRGKRIRFDLYRPMRKI